jgi:hypothetical protein
MSGLACSEGCQLCILLQNNESLRRELPEDVEEMVMAEQELGV